MDATDSAGNNDGVVLPGGLYSSGLVGSAFRVGHNVGGVEVRDSPDLDFGPGENFSIEAWVRSFSRSTWVQDIIDKRLAPPPPNFAVGYVLALVNGRPAFQMADAPLAAGQHSTWVAATSDLRDGQFHHIAVTLDRDSPNGGVLYADGVPVMIFDPTTESGDLSNDESLLIGRHPTPRFFSPPRYYWWIGDLTGDVDEAAIYSRVLLPFEILAIYDAGAAGKCASIEDRITHLIELVEDLMKSGVLNSGQANALIAKLIGTLSALEKGNPNAATNKLSAFANQVEALMNGNTLTAAEGQPLIDSANAIIDQINNGG